MYTWQALYSMYYIHSYNHMYNILIIHNIYYICVYICVRVCAICIIYLLYIIFIIYVCLYVYVYVLYGSLGNCVWLVTTLSTLCLLMPFGDFDCSSCAHAEGHVCSYCVGMCVCTCRACIIHAHCATLALETCTHLVSIHTPTSRLGKPLQWQPG